MPSSAFWMIALIVLVAGEVVTVGLSLIWFAVGALGAMIVAGLGGELWLQLLIFFLLSGVSLLLLKPMARRFLKTTPSATNADRVIGQIAVVTQNIDNIAGHGQVNIAGQIWTARSQHNVVIPIGTEVKVLQIEGVKVFVETQ